MSVHVIYYKDGAKMMRPVLTREEYLSLRGSKRQQNLVAQIRSGKEELKSKLLQFAYSCLPNPDGSLKDSATLSTTVGMDIDHIPADKMQELKDRILSKKADLGLLMLELSARAAGYHLVFRRQENLNQEENLTWASNLLKVEFDKGAKDITRVFYTTTASAQDLLYLDDEIFVIKEAECKEKQIENGKLKIENSSTCVEEKLTQECDNFQFSIFNSQLKYNGIPYSDIITKY